MIEFFSNEEGVISPSILSKNYKKIGSSLIFCFFHDVIDELLFEHKIEYYQTIFGENSYIIYKYIDEEIYIVHGIVGAPASSIMLEELIALGANKIVFVGCAGYLKPEIKNENIFLVKGAISNDGTSHHYLKFDYEIPNESPLFLELKDFFTAKKIPFNECITFTTDGLYRETKEKLNWAINNGASTVEMEQSALIAVSKFRNAQYASILYAHDDVSKDNYDDSNDEDLLLWRKFEDVRRDLVNYCHDFLKSK